MEKREDRSQDDRVYRVFSRNLNFVRSPYQLRILCNLVSKLSSNLAILLCCFMANSLQAIESPVIQQGVLDLTEWDLDENPVVELHGQAEFYWQKYLRQDRVDTQDREFVDLISLWSEAKTHGSRGYGSYRWRVKLEKIQEIALRFTSRAIVGSFEIYVDGVLLSHSGRIGRQAETTSSLPKMGHVLRFTPRATEFEILIQMANFESPGSGIIRPIFLGRSEQVLAEQERLLAISALLVGTSLIMGVYHLGLFVRRRSDPSALYFGLACLGLGMQYVVYSPTESTRIFENYSERFSLLIFTSCWCIFIAMFAAFTESLFPLKSKRKYSSLVLLLSLSLQLLVYLFPRQNYFQLYSTVAISYLVLGYCFILAVRALYQGQSGALVYLLSSIILTVGIIGDTLIFMGLLSSSKMRFSGFGNFAFILGQSYLLSTRFAMAFRQIEVLSGELIEKDKARTQFFQNTSHELRTPLNGILGFLQLLLKRHSGELPGMAQQQIETCIRLGQGLKNQINSILDLAKFKKGLLEIGCSLIHLDDLAKDAEDLALGLNVNRPNTSFSLVKSWKIGEDDFINDREKINTILRNLLGNAFKFSNPMTSNKICLQLTRTAELLQIVVSDTGIGIDDSDQDRIFDEFSQISGDARRSFEGTGLGLTVVKNLVSILGGKIKVESKLNEGACFTITIPEQKVVQQLQDLDEEIVDQRLLNAAAAGILAKARKPAFESSQQNRQMSPKRILIVDDLLTNCQMLEALLSSEGYDAAIALSGEEALQKLRGQSADLILLDLMMPFMSGEDVLSAIKQDSLLCKIPVILLTARASDSDRVFGLSLGADDYLAKPIHQEELLFRIRNLLERFALTSSLVATREKDKLSQLGGLFFEMSHEIKNIYQISSNMEDLSRSDQHLLLNSLPIESEAWPDVLAAILSDPVLAYSSRIQSSALPFPDEKSRASQDLRILRYKLVGLEIDDKLRYLFWQNALEMSRDELHLLVMTLELIHNFSILKLQAGMAQEFMEAVLGGQKKRSEQSFANLTEVWSKVLRLAQMRIKTLQIKPSSEFTIKQIPFASGDLLHIFLNFVLNAIECIEKLDPTERWIKISSAVTAAGYELRLSNGGPPLSSKFLVHSLELLGESGKGSTGVGLNLSRRLAAEAGASFEADISQLSPCFVLLIPNSKYEIGKPLPKQA